MSKDPKVICNVKNSFLEFFEKPEGDAVGGQPSTRRSRAKTDGFWVPGMSPAIGPAAGPAYWTAKHPKPSPKRLPKSSPGKVPAPSPGKLPVPSPGKMPSPSPCRLPAWPETPLLEAAYEHQDPALNNFDWMLPACAGQAENPWMLGEDGMPPFDWMMMPYGPYPDAFAPEMAFWDGNVNHPSSSSTASGEEVTAGSNAEGGANAEQCKDWRTTVMLRGLPTDLTRDALVNMLNGQGFIGFYDLVYLPVDFSTGVGLGYAFVNCTCPSLVNQIWTAFDDRKEWPDESDKVCSVSWSDPHQGLASHIERYQNSPVMHHEVPDGWKPALYVHGMRVDFPPPTKRIKAPKVRSKKTPAAETKD